MPPTSQEPKTALRRAVAHSQTARVRSTHPLTPTYTSKQARKLEDIATMMQDVKMPDEKIKDAAGTITVELQPLMLQRATDSITKAINIRNVRGLPLFFGFGEEKPFNLPARDTLAPRARKNAVYFATNYAVSAALVTVVTILMNPLFLFLLMCVGGFWFYGANRAPDAPPVVIFGRTLTPQQHKMGMGLGTVAMIVLFGGSILFSIFTASGALAGAHAVLRDCPVVQEEDELGFMSDDSAKVDSVV